MKNKRAYRCLPTRLIGLAASVCLGLIPGLCLGPGNGRAEEAKPPLAVQLLFDRPLEASMAPFIVAENRGLFAAEGLSVRNDFVNGSPEAIARVASGTSDFALVDINELIRFRSKTDASPVKAVFVLFNQSPYAIVARKSRGVRALADIEGKTIGVAEGDLSFHLWPALAKQNGIKTPGMKLYKMSAAVREPILSAGQVDAVAGFSYLSAVNLRDRGVPDGDLAVLRYNDYGCEAYGFAVIVNPAFAAAKPDAVKGFVRAAISGTNFAIRKPEAAVDDVVSRMEGGARDLELERLRTVIADNILTGEVKRKGLGGIDAARMERAIDQVGEDFKFHKRPHAADIFDDTFLPPVGGRLIN
jgi:NitT/TauT family transport system substrate-binding protein